jgi:hypothetical protein
MAKSKYATVLIWLILIGAIIVLDLSTFIGIILAIDAGAVIGTLVLVRPEIEKAMKKSRDKELLRKDPPLDWLNNSNRFFGLSLFASLAYLIMVSFNFGVGAMPFGSDSMLFFSLAFFVLAIIHLFRISEFIHSPSSKANMTVSRIYYWFAEIGFRVSFMGFIITIEVFNGLMFYLILVGLMHNITLFGIMFDSAVIISFATVFPIGLNTLFHPRKQANRKDSAIFVIFYLPEIVLIVAGFLLIMGFKPF